MKDILENIYNESEEKYYSYLFDLINKNQKKFIITVNPEIIMKSYKDKTIKDMLLNKDNSLVPDGISVVKKAKLYKIKIKERITGIDISSKLITICKENNKSIYLFGSKEEVVSSLYNKLKKENVNVLGYTNGYVKDKDKEFEKIVKLKPDVILVALGVPNQELLINKHINKFSKGIFVGVGGSFDVLSSYKKRAPKFFIKCHLEWLYRIVKEPKRIKRFIENNIIFMFKK
ncbi:MAG: WecB/TagA/CpsF family glycosyltransferase [Mollicutes bacterium]|nr:WecB/TagA/CpsF family glycosyltransferase [Mollicutes bacterium]